MPARARWSRQRSIRALLALGLVVPLVCLLALWGFGTGVTMSRAAADHDFTAVDRLYSGPVQPLRAALAAEQLQVVTWLSAGRPAPVAPLLARFRVTDRAATAFLAAAHADQPVIPSAARPALHALESLLAGRAALRAGAQGGQLTALAAVRAYGAILTAVDGFDARLLVVDDASLSRQAAATVEADSGVDLARGEIALAAGAAAAGGAMSTPERVLFAQDGAGARLMINSAVTVLDPRLGSGYLRVRNSAAYRAVGAVEAQIAAVVGDVDLVPVDAPAVASSASALSTGYLAAQRQNAAGLASLAAQASGTATLVATLIAGLGLVAVLASIVLAIYLWWRITSAVTGLTAVALTVADQRPPRLAGPKSVAGAGDGPAVPVPGPAGRITELATASAALVAAQQLARQTVAAQDQLRSGASQFLRNLGLRSHALAYRQLTMLEVIESGTSDPQTLAGLVAVSQLSARMRRHADGLLVLSGGSLARSEQAPLPVGDLIRAAASDVDDGSRVSVVGDALDAVTADAVADVRHLIAELVENAVRHTPQLAEVTVRTGRAGRGLVVEVEDHGPGFAEADLERANALLTDPPEIGLAVGDGLGLLVVARLAVRHAITVSLRGSPIGGGTTAIVLLPHAILVAGEVTETIVDGSLPRIDDRMPVPVVPSPSSGSPAPPGRADSAAPWHWLTATQPVRTSAPEPPGVPADEPRGAGEPRRASDPGAPAPLPRRIRPAQPPSGPGTTSGAAPADESS